jgi:hypothetical protein
MKGKKDRVVTTKSGIKYTISDKVKCNCNDPYFERKADEGQKFLEKVGIPEEFKKKK